MFPVCRGHGDIYMTIHGTRWVFAGASFVAIGMGATAANAATANAAALAKVLSQVTVTQQTDLEFGTIVAGTSASTVAINAFGARTCGAGLACTGATGAAAFSVTGTAGRIVTVSVPVSITLTNGTDTMNANLAASAPGLLLGVGGASFTVGGTLDVGASQVDGDYSATFDATVDYQ